METFVILNMSFSFEKILKKEEKDQRQELQNTISF